MLTNAGQGPIGDSAPLPNARLRAVYFLTVFLVAVFLVAVSPVAAAPIDGWAEESRRGAEDVNVEDCRDA